MSAGDGSNGGTVAGAEAPSPKAPAPEPVVVSWEDLQGAAAAAAGRGDPDTRGFAGAELLQSLTLLGLLAGTLIVVLGLGFLLVRAFS
jgi:hypothetical protein